MNMRIPLNVLGYCHTVPTGWEMAQGASVCYWRVCPCILHQDFSPPRSLRLQAAAVRFLIRRRRTSLTR